jgi:hypothetical protein
MFLVYTKLQFDERERKEGTLSRETTKMEFQTSFRSHFHRRGEGRKKEREGREI